tara:strand:+ start:240 stop:626 length:387 start_codon:yes stop_codon:yes gene_type:complete
VKILHLINKTEAGEMLPKGVSKSKEDDNIYISCCWDFKLEEAKALIGGMIFFHDTKSERSKLGGNVVSVQPVRLDEETEFHKVDLEDKNKRQSRVMFKFEISPEGREQIWRGKDHSMSWTSDIIDLEK